MSLTDSELELAYVQSRDSFFKFVQRSVTTVVAIAAWPLGFLIPLGPMEARTGFCFLIVIFVFLLSWYVRALYTRCTEMNCAKRKVLMRIAQRSQHTTIVAEPALSTNGR